MRRLTVFLFLFALLASFAAASAVPPEITALPGQVNPYKTRSELLMDASDYTGVITPEQAAALWAQGLKMRSAAMQYTVMTEKLKKAYSAQLDALRSNWVTGMSSPSVQNYAIVKTEMPDAAHARCSLMFEVAATRSPPEYYGAELSLVREGNFWRISRIRADDGLYPYTLYKP